MISYSDFHNLRIRDLINSNPDEIEQLKNWEFMDNIWEGEGIGFSQFLRPITDKKTTKAIALDLQDFKEDNVKKIAERFGVQFQYGLKIEELELELGKAKEIESFLPDRKTYNFLIGEKEQYYFSATFHKEKGLIYIEISNHPKILKELK